ncbi:hypothetical protein A3J41_02145 [candidate division TM6 bacterium RIFCSPHIGHO2_12_FULL_38_8]|nr:MAG: hypothetical protein A3J41_02145 [candidate division TM6 bacterium RIFCSPHIGHO2_12_FULL_38_8]
MFLNLYAGSTSLFNVVDAIPYSPAAFMIVNSSTWDVVTPMTTLPPSTTGLGSYLAQQGISQVSGISLQKAVIDQDLCMVTVTSQGISNQIVSNSAIYTLTGSNAIMNNISTLTNGVYVAINSWDQGATYTLYDNQGNSLGTGTVSVFGSSSGTILGGILSSSGFQYGKFALQAVNGKIPRCMLLQYPAPTPYSAPSSGSGSGSAGSVNFAQIATLALSIQDLSKELSPLNAQLKSAVGKTAKQTINAQINTIQNSIMTAQASIKKAQVVLSGTALYTGAFKSTGGSSVPVQRGTTIFNIPAATLPAGGLQFINVGLTDAASSGWMVFEFDNTIISQFPAAVLSAGLYVAIEILKLGLAFTAKVSLMDSNEGIYAYGKQQIPAGAVLTQANVGFNMNDTSIAPVANQVRVNGVPLTHPSPLVLFQAQAAATS